MRCRPATRATPMLNSSSIRLRRRESVSLGRFQNCNLLEMDHFSRHGVEDDLGGENESPFLRCGWVSRCNFSPRRDQTAFRPDSGRWVCTIEFPIAWGNVRAREEKVI